MDAKRHAFLARRLIGRCGGLRAAEAACRTSRSTLQLYESPHHPQSMPADVLFDLETYAGDKMYSRELSAGVHATECDGVQAETSEATEQCAVLQRLARLAAQDGELSETEKGQLRAGLAELELIVLAVREAIERGRP